MVCLRSRRGWEPPTWLGSEASVAALAALAATGAGGNLERPTRFSDAPAPCELRLDQGPSPKQQSAKHEAANQVPSDQVPSAVGTHVTWSHANRCSCSCFPVMHVETVVPPTSRGRPAAEAPLLHTSLQIGEAPGWAEASSSSHAMSSMDAREALAASCCR